MNFDITRQSLFKTILFFLIFYVFFRGREYFYPAADPGYLLPLPWPGEKLREFLLLRPVLSEGVLFAFTFLNGFYITRIITRNMLLLERTYMPALVYLFFSAGITTGSAAPLLAMVGYLVIFATDSFISSHKKREQFHFFFHASVALGIIPLLFAPGVALLLMLPVCLLLYRRQWRDIVVSVVGYLLPFGIVSYVLWGMGENFSALWYDLTGNLRLSLPGHGLTPYPYWDYAFYALVLFVSVLSLRSFAKGYKNMRSRASNGYRTFLWLLPFMFLMLPAVAQPWMLLPLLAIPLSLVVPTYFNRIGGALPNLVYLLFTGCFILYNLFIVLHL